jgi:hypothetical protein
MRKIRRGIYGGALLETLLLWMFVATGTMVIGERLQQAELQMMHAAFDPIVSALESR